MTTRFTQGMCRLAARCAAAPAIAGLLLLAGCEGMGNNQKITYSDTSADDEAFARGANRPPTANTLYRTGKILAAQGKDDLAIATFNNTIERYPDHLPAYADLAALYVRQGKVNSAIQTLENGLKVEPNDPVLLNDLGMCHVVKEQYEQALDNFTMASAADPENARYIGNMAMANGMMGQYDEAFNLYTRIVKPAKAHYNVAVMAESRNDHDKANEEYAKALALDPHMQRKQVTR